MRSQDEPSRWTVACVMLWLISLAAPACAERPMWGHIHMAREADAASNTLSSTGCDSMSAPPAEQPTRLANSSFEEEPETLGERLENLGRIYENEDHPVMQEWWLLGRYHGQYYTADEGDTQVDAWESRRFRIGSQARFFEKLTLHAQMVSGSDVEPFYNGFTEIWSRWAFDDLFAITVGQQKHRFTHERNVSSRYINTLERSLLVNMFNADYTPAVTASGSSDKFDYYTGIFSNATGPNIGEAFTQFDSGYSLLASGTWDIEKLIPLDEAFLNLCYLHSDANENATNLNRFGDSLSAALIFTEGPTSLISEFILGTQGANGNAFGINLHPGYFLTDKLQLATRYQLAISDEEQGLIPQLRYEQPVNINAGDLYQAGYFGFNYYIAQHRLKLMHGVEYANMNGEDLLTASIAIRLFWGPHSKGPFPMAELLEQ